MGSGGLSPDYGYTRSASTSVNRELQRIINRFFSGLLDGYGMSPMNTRVKYATQVASGFL